MSIIEITFSVIGIILIFGLSMFYSYKKNK